MSQARCGLSNGFNTMGSLSQLSLLWYDKGGKDSSLPGMLARAGSGGSIVSAR